MKKKKATVRRSRANRRITVRGVRKSPPDLDKLVRALIAMAREENSGDSADEHLKRQVQLDEISLEMKLLDQQDGRNGSSESAGFK